MDNPLTLDDLARVIYEATWAPRTWADVPPVERSGYRGVARAVVLAMAPDLRALVGGVVVGGSGVAAAERLLALAAECEEAERGRTG